MTSEDRINNLVKLAELQLQAIDKLTSDVSELTQVVRKHESELKMIKLTLSRLAEAHHTH